MENTNTKDFTFTEGMWVKLRQVTEKNHRVPNKAKGKWTQVFRTTVHGNAYVHNPSGASCLSIRPIDIEDSSLVNPGV